MSDFARNPNGQQFTFAGMKLNSRPDTLPPGKYPIAVNVRAYGDSTIQTRPGLSRLFVTATSGAVFITDMRAYTALGTDNLPRILGYKSDGKVVLDNGVLIATLASSNAPLASMIPFRPNQSPNPYMYIANGSDYQKFSAPVVNAVTAQNVGIAEPQAAPDAFPTFQGVLYTPFSTLSIAGGTSGGETPGNRTTDTIVRVFAWPAPSARLFTIQTGAGIQYQRFQQLILDFGASNQNCIVQDVYQPITTAITLQAVQYFAGSTGRCVIVPANIANSPGGGEQSIFSATLLAGLRRGALISFAGGSAEVAFVLSVAEGPNGTISVETSTTVNHAAGETITVLPAIEVLNLVANSPNNGQTIHSGHIAFQVTTGIGTQSGAANSGVAPASSLQSFQPDDFIVVGMWIDTLTNLTEAKLLLDIGDGSFTQNFFYYTIRPSDIVSAIANSLTQLAAAQIVSQRAIIDEEQAASSRNQLTTASSAQALPGSSQWTQLRIPIGALTRVGDDQTLTLQNVNNVQMLFNASGTINVRLSDPIFFMGGFQPNVGDAGAPYRYRVRPRSSVTGVVGNPSPATRYGVNPQRQQITVSLPSAAYDTQIDTWDIFRYGGSVTSWRFIGSTASSNSTFLDNYGDEAAQAGDALDFDNFEPWPSIDVPLNVTATSVAGTIAAVTIPSPTNALRFLPGNLVRVGGQNVYTLWARPTLISGTSYLFQFVENAGSGTNLPVSIYEPALARQFLPYMWGPDVNGTVFAVGDPLRAGTLYFAKGNNPDSAPDSYNQEIVQPAEPLMGGEVLDGLSFVASSERWWALFPQPTNPTQRYAAVQQPFPRGLAAPLGHCTDGVSIYWWAKDGIQSSTKGSLTDADLYNLFPHEGIPGVAVTYNGITIQPPDYSRANSFRLTHSNGYLYASYQDSSQVYRMLVLDLRRMAWCADSYAFPVSSTYHVEQPEGSLLSSGTLYSVLLMATRDASGSFHAVVCKQQANTDDDSNAIICQLAVNEFDGGDIRAPKQWGDFFLDLVPASSTGVSVTPMSLGVGVASAAVIASGASRTRQPISVGGVVVSDFLGLFLQWTDEFSIQTAPTQLYSWQPSFTLQPARDIEWFTFGTSFGLSGYMHIREIVAAWVSTAAITLAITSFDGQSPAAIIIPSSGGAYQKQVFPVSANKGQLYKFHASSAQPFQFFLDDFEVRVGSWGRTAPYMIAKNFGGNDARTAVL